MAKETIVNLVDDLDGGKAAETVSFSLDGTAYEIDLSARNATKLRTALQPYLEHGTRIRPTRATPATRRSAGRGNAATDNQAIRAWAQRKGYEIASRGRIQQAIVEEYQATGGR